MAVPGGAVGLSLPGGLISAPSRSGSSVVYRGVAPGTDLVYTPSAGGVKEELVLASAASPTSFTFQLADPAGLLGAVAETTGEGWEFSRSLQDGARLVLAPPTAWEQKTGQHSGPRLGSAHQVVHKIPGGFSVTLSVDPAWLKGKSFPIVLDPSLTFDYPDSTISDAYAPVGATDCAGAPCLLSNGYSGTPSGVFVTAPNVLPFTVPPVVVPDHRAYFHVNLSTLVGNSRVTSAVFRVEETNIQDDYFHPELTLHAVNTALTGSSTGADLAAAEDPAVLAHLEPRGVGVFPCRLVFWAGLDCEEADFDITNQVSRWIGQGPTAAASAGWALQTTATNNSEYFDGPQLDITYVGDPVPAPIPVAQSYGCDCRWSHGAAVSAQAGDPVKTNTGASLESVTDVSTSAPGVNLALSRAYNGADSTVSPLGAGWTDSFAVTATKDAGTGNVTVRDGSGGQTVFAAQTGGGYTPAPGVDASLASSGGGWVLTTPRREALAFDASGRITSDKDEQGHGLTYGYSGSSLATVTDATGQVATMGYGTSGAATGMVTSVVLSDGRSVGYGYTLIAGTAHLTSSTAVDGSVTTMTYDPTTGALTGIRDPNSHTASQNTFDPITGRITSQTDAAGAVTTFSWDPATDTETVTDPLGRVTRDVYNPDGHGGQGNVLIDHYDAVGERTHYSYDANLNIVAVTDPSGAATVMTYDSVGNMLTRTQPAPLNYTETWTYDAKHHPLTYTDGRGHTTTKVYNTAGQLTSSTTADGAVTRYTYTTTGLLATVKDPLGHTTTNTYNAVGDLVSVKNPTGGVTTSTFDSAHRLLTRTDPRGTTAAYRTTWTYDGAGRVLTVTDPLGRTTHYGYDAVGNRTSSTDPTGAVTTSVFDADNRLVSTTDPLGHTTTNTYDTAGELTSTTTATGATTTFGYDADGRRTTVTRPDGNTSGASAATHDAYTTTTTYDVDGRPVTVTAPDPAQPGQTLTTRTTYDPMGRVTTVTDPAGNITSTAYDEDGNVIAVTDPRQAITTTTYDVLNRPLVVTDANNNATTSSYDLVGNQLTISDATGDLTRWTYDAANRRITQVDPRGTIAGATPATYTTTYTYDKASNLTKTTDPLAHAITTAYDGANQVTSVTDRRGKKTSYTYDAAGRVRTVTTPMSAVTTYGYDSAGNLTTTSTPLARVSTRTYDASNRLLTATTPAGHLTAYSYDPDGNVLTSVLPSGTSTPTVGDGTVTIGYDTLDRRTSTTYSDGTPAVTLGYDTAGRLASLSDGQPLALKFGYDAAGHTTSVARVNGPTSTGFTYQVDPVGNVTARTQPDGSTTTATYDANERLATLRWPTAAGTSTATYGYDPAGLPTTRTVGPVTSTTSYDPAGRPTALTHTAGATTIAAFTQTLDPAGDPTLISTTRAGTTSTTGYGYDNGARLTSWCPGVPAGTTTCTGAATATTYTLDKDGNRTKAVTVGTSATTATSTYNTDDQLTKTVTTGTGAGTTTYTYDPNGNQATSVTAAATTASSYNLASQLTTLTTPAASTTYTYDGLGNRATRTTGPVTTNYTWDVNNPLPQLAATTDGSGTPLTRYTTTANGTLAEHTATGDALTLTDLQANTTDLTDTTGATLGTWAYTPYGQLTTNTGTDPRVTANTQLFASQYLDTDTGLYNNRARQYAPALGRFTSIDPLTPTPFTSPYQYGRGNPMLWSDPSGRDACDNSLLSAICSVGSGIGDLVSAGVQEVKYQIDAVGADTGSNWNVLNPTLVAASYADAASQVTLTQEANSFGGMVNGGTFGGYQRILCAVGLGDAYDTHSPEYQTSDFVGVNLSLTGATAGIGEVFAWAVDAFRASRAARLAAAAEAAGEGGDLTTLYRAVGKDELKDIEGTGQYRPAPSGIGGKYFFPTKEQAESFQGMLAKSGQGSSCITSGCIPTSLLRGVDVIQPAGEGPAYFVPNELLPYFNSIVIHGP